MYLGADTDQMRSVAQSLRAVAADLQTLSGQQHLAAEALDWSGPDFVAFKAEAGSAIGAGGTIMRLHRRVVALAGVLERNGSAQDVTSETLDPSGASGDPDGVHSDSAPDAAAVEHADIAMEDLNDLFKQFVGNTQLVGDVAEWAKRLPVLQSISRELGPVGVAMHLDDLIGGIRSGSIDKISRAVLDLGWDAAGKTALGKAIKTTWDVAYLTGTTLGNVIESTFHFQDSIVRQGVQNGGTDNIGTRYDGVPGFGNFIGDAVGALNPFD